MQIILILLAALLPPALLWIYICGRDPRPEPLNWLLRATLYGIVICFPVAQMEAFLHEFLGIDALAPTLSVTTAEAFLVAALPEESFKLLALWLVLRRNPYFDEHFDGIVYAVCVGLGFAAIENVTYLFSYSDQWINVGISRAIFAVPGHYAFAILMGYYYSLHHFCGHSWQTAVAMLAVPVIAHGIYDTIAMSGQTDTLVGALSTVLLVIFCIRMHKLAHRRLLAQLKRDQQTPPPSNPMV